MDNYLDIPQYLKYLITGIGTLLAILGLFIDKSASYFKYTAPVFILLVVVLGVFQAIDAVESDKDAETAAEQRSRLLELVDNSSISSMRTSSYLTDILLSQPKILRDFGISEKRAGKPLDQISTSELVEGEILEANKYRMQLIAERVPSERLDTKVWYYNKEMDSPEIINALKEAGLTIENKIAQRNQANDLTNAVWYGPEVNFNDYKAVIVSLIRAGIDIKRTGPSCKNTGAKTGVIEVGASDKAAGLVDGIVSPTKSISLIKGAEFFSELRDFEC